jgi:hypothetical protein
VVKGSGGVFGSVSHRFLFLLVWADAIGVPLYLFIDLYRHKIHFYADKEGAVSDKHDWAYQKLGAMFTQYE